VVPKQEQVCDLAGLVPEKILPEEKAAAAGHSMMVEVGEMVHVILDDAAELGRVPGRVLGRVLL
jgi:hypothetical protein